MAMDKITRERSYWAFTRAVKHMDTSAMRLATVKMAAQLKRDFPKDFKDTEFFIECGLGADGTVWKMWEQEQARNKALANG